MPRQCARFFPKGPAPLSQLGAPHDMLTVYEGPQHFDERLVEFWWDPAIDPLYKAVPLERWFTQAELLSAALPICATYFDNGRANWIAASLACESAFRTGEYGYFAARLLTTNDLIAAMRDGAERADGNDSSKWVKEYVASVPRGQHSYLYTVRKVGGWILRDGATCRPGGGRNANDALGTGYPTNSELMEDGLLRCRTRIEPLRPGMSASARRRSEIMYDYGDKFFSGLR